MTQPPDMVASSDMTVSPDMASTCSHSPCTKGVSLGASCSSCVQKFCADNIDGDPYCCNVQWDATCVTEYKAYPTCSSC